MDAFTKDEIQGMSVCAGGRVSKLLRSGKKEGRGGQMHGGSICEQVTSPRATQSPASGWRGEHRDASVLPGLKGLSLKDCDLPDLRYGK